MAKSCPRWHPLSTLSAWIPAAALLWLVAAAAVGGLASCRRPEAPDRQGGDEPSALLQPGDTAPDFTFADQAGETRSLSDCRPRAVVMNFIFTRCGVQEFCPRANRQFTALREALDASPWRDRVELVSVTLDPEHDTPEVLGPFAEFHQAAPGRWTFATLPRPRLEELKRAFGVWTRPGEDGTIDHNLRTAVVGSGGRVLALWEGNRWTSEEILAVLGRGHEPTGDPGGAAVLP